MLLLNMSNLKNMSISLRYINILLLKSLSNLFISFQPTQDFGHLRKYPPQVLRGNVGSPSSADQTPPQIEE